MTLRDRRQQEFAQVFLNNNCFGTLNLCPRFGKIYTTINILEKLDDGISILIAYPDLNIEQSWKDDFEKRGYDDSNVTYTTHMSLKKHTDKLFDLVILDEIHLLSENQLQEAAILLKQNRKVLGLTGTLAKKSQMLIYFYLKMPIIAEYPIEQAIKEKVITDYQISVISVNLDDKLPIKYKNKVRTEKAQYKALSFVIDRLETEEKPTFFMRLNRMRLLQNSVGKREWAKNYLARNKNKRILIFCGTIKVAESLDVPYHHSKSNNKSEFEDFVSGKGNHMAVVNIGMTGVTYKPLNEIIIMAFDSNLENLTQKINRCMAMEYDNLDKKANIIILCSNTVEEKSWLSKALKLFDKNKINYV